MREEANIRSASVHSQATSGLSLDNWHTMIHMIDPHLVNNFFNNFLDRLIESRLKPKKIIEKTKMELKRVTYGKKTKKSLVFHVLLDDKNYTMSRLSTVQNTIFSKSNT